MMDEREIPEDVLLSAQRAQDAAIERCKAAKLSVAEYPFASGAAKNVLDEEIARAIMAERERAAKIAVSFARQHGEPGAVAENPFANVYHVAAAIRTPSP